MCSLTCLARRRILYISTLLLIFWYSIFLLSFGYASDCNGWPSASWWNTGHTIYSQLDICHERWWEASIWIWIWKHEYRGKLVMLTSTFFFLFFVKGVWVVGWGRRNGWENFLLCTDISLCFSYTSRLPVIWFLWPINSPTLIWTLLNKSHF